MNTLPRALSYVRLEDVMPALDNGGRVHDLPGIMHAIRALGFNDPLTCDERTGRLVSGHGRVEALVELRATGASLPDGIVVGDDGGWLVPVVRGWTSNDDAEAAAQLLAFNKLPQNARYNDNGLAGLLESIATDRAGLLDATGFEHTEIDALLRTVTPEFLVERDPDLADRRDITEPFKDPTDTSIQDRPDRDEPASPSVCCPSCGHIFLSHV